jgi:hypothetical protein
VLQRFRSKSSSSTFQGLPGSAELAEGDDLIAFLLKDRQELAEGLIGVFAPRTLRP